MLKSFSCPFIECYVLRGNSTLTDKNLTGQGPDTSGWPHQYGATYYDPILARFTQPDTVVPDYQNPQSLNRYAYVLNNPLKYTDPTGHRKESWFDGGGGSDEPPSEPGYNPPAEPPPVVVPSPLASPPPDLYGSPPPMRGPVGTAPGTTLSTPSGLPNVRFPDYYSANINVAIPTPWTYTLLGWSGQLTIDRYRRMYLPLLGGNVGKAAMTVGSSSIVAG